MNLDQFFSQKRKILVSSLKNESLGASFSNLSGSLLSFLYAEKLCSYVKSEERYACNKEGDYLDGYSIHYEREYDLYHSRCCTPFNIKGFWIPETEGKLFSILKEEKFCPFIRNSDFGREFLFLIHPKSEEVFAPLIERYAASEQILTALALSSFRTLLVAIPGEDSQSSYAMVKVSLNETISRVLRIVSLKECAGSVAATDVLLKKQSSIEFMKDEVSFVVDSSLLNPNYTESINKGAGMICRTLLSCLSNSKEHVLPLFALFGVENQELLDLIIQQMKKTPTVCVVNFLLKPLAVVIVELLYKQHVSLEIHAQNVLAAIDTSIPEDIKIRLIYRDMGGVNCLLTDQDWNNLPSLLQDEDYFYRNNHVKDAANILENKITGILFHLTKQFFKSEAYEKIDPLFAEWKEAMVERGYTENWTLPGEDLNAYRNKLSEKAYYRYGYFEKLFAQVLLETMSLEGIFVEIDAHRLGIGYSFFLEQLYPSNNPYDPCLNINWFSDLIFKTYPLYCLRILKNDSCIKYIDSHLKQARS